MWMTGNTDIGRRRETNQDTFLFEALPGGEGLLIVCDGMGGVQGGAVASSLALETAAESLRRSLAGGPMDEMQVGRSLECAAAAANSVVYETGRGDPSLCGMGTTLVGAVVLPDRAQLVHVGDSRAYLLHEGALSQLTTDHNVAQQLVENGTITAQDARNHPRRNYLTRAIGIEPEQRFDILSVPLQGDDLLLLCSDGLYNFLDDAELPALMAEAFCCGNVSPLVERANENGGGDNITAVLCRVADREKQDG